MPRLEEWAHKRLTPLDAVVFEMTTNAYEVYDALRPLVHSVTLVHPPHVALVTRVQVKTDEKAALALAKLHAVGLLESIWIPPDEVRDLRALIAERRKLKGMQTQIKNRLHSVLHRCRIVLPPGGPFSEKNREWWTKPQLSPLEQTRVQGYLETLDFIEGQVEKLEACLVQTTASDPRLPLLVQLPGVGLVVAATILGAVGTISRFATASRLVGYAGLGTRVHNSGQTHRSGRITKAGRRELRTAMVEAAQRAVLTHPYWQEKFERLEARLGCNKAIVAIARKLLVVVWHVLETADRHAQAEQVARSLLRLVYRIGVGNLPDGQTATVFTREQLDRLGIGQELERVPWGSRRPRLPASRLAPTQG
ncbi:MAG: IS110 family transposase [Chloroflexi bacterium]|nr:IS110 family transposase [Chloroflexota bacterium]